MGIAAHRMGECVRSIAIPPLAANFGFRIAKTLLSSTALDINSGRQGPA